MSSILEELTVKVNEACVQLVNHQPYCTLCEAKLPSQANYDSHTSGKNHRGRTIGILTQLMGAALSPGITMTTQGVDDDDDDAPSIRCVLCEQTVSQLFDSAFHAHLSSDAHRNKVQWQETQRKCRDLDAYYDGPLAGPQEDTLVKGVSRAGIVVAKNGRYRCVPCDCEFVDRLAFVTHVKGATHREWVVDQLTKVADKVGVSLGIIVENGSLRCKLCNNCKLGDGLATADAYNHVSCDAHKQKVVEQLDGGLREYYDEDSDFDPFGSDFSDESSYFYDSDDLSFEYELQAPWWDSDDRDMFYYMALDAAYNSDNSWDDF